MSSESNSPPAEPTGVNRLDPWMRRNPRYVAGIWALLALISAAGVVLADSDEPMFALKLVLTLGWTLLAFREVRRYRAQLQRGSGQLHEKTPTGTGSS